MKKMNFGRSFGATIRAIRRMKKMSQKEIEKLTGIPQTSISDFETGKRLPDVREALKISAALNISITELLEGGDTNEPRTENSRDSRIPRHANR